MTGTQDVHATRAFASRVDFGRAASDYRTFRGGFPDAFFQTLIDRGFVRPGQFALDLGTGTGTVARGLARLGLRVTGIDPSRALLTEAASLDREARVEVAYRVGAAERLAEGDGSLDVVTAGQCWHWFDRATVAREAFRTLKNGGRIVIAHIDWLPLAGNVVEMTEKLILAHNPDWTMAGGSGIYPQWMRDLADARFGGLESFSFDIALAYSHQAMARAHSCERRCPGKSLRGRNRTFRRRSFRTASREIPDGPALGAAQDLGRDGNSTPRVSRPLRG